MRPIATDHARNVVCVLVTRVWNCQDSIWRGGGRLTHVGPRNHVDWDSPSGRGQFWGLSGPLKSIGSLCCSVCSKGYHSVLDNGMIAGLLQLTAMLPAGQSHATLSDGCSCVEQSSNQCHYSYFPGFLQKTVKDIFFH